MRDKESEALARTVQGIGDHKATSNQIPSRMQLDAPSIPGYRIDRVLGEGGMGTVYAAEQEAPRRRVAIKVLQSRSGTALARFQAEAEIMARLDHPGIARVLEAGEADGHPFLVMEHVDGMTLDRFAKELLLAKRLELFVALCEAVHHAHVKGVIHRDLKPSNVMVKDGARVVVLDFGVARLAADDDRTPGTTRAGELIGTPLYMSPEQARLRPDEVDVRTDVYTLGVMLYELACGQLPYDARPGETPLPILTMMICEEPPIPLAKTDPALRGDLDAITAKALAKEPKDRYQSVAALGDDVRRYLAGLPVSVRTPGALERLGRFVRRRPLVAAGIAGAVAAVASFAVVVTYLYLEASTARRTAEDARGRTETARALLESRTNQLVLRQARSALARDPTEALAWLATLTPKDVDPGTAWAIADEAVARGVAKDVLRGHADEVHWIEALPGGFVSAAYDGRVIVWDPAQRPVFVAKKGRVHLARPSPDGATIAVGGDDGALTIVARDGKVLAELVGHAGDVQRIAWTRDGSTLVTADDHGRVLVWPHGRAPGRQLDTGTAANGAVAFSPSGRELVAGDHDGNVWLWDLAGNARLVTSTAPAEVVEAWTDGTRVAAVDATGAVHAWKRDGDRLVADKTLATQLNCKRAVFAPDGTWALLGGVGGTVTRVDLAAGTVEPVTRFRGQVRSLAISADGRWFAAGGDDGSLEARDRTTGQIVALHGHTGRIRHVAFADGDRVLLSSDSDGIVRRWELAAMPATVLDTRGEPAERVVVAPDGALVAMVDGSGEVATWSIADRRYTRLGHVDGRATALAIAGGVVVTGTAEGAVTWWTKTPVRQPLHGIVKDIAAEGDVVAVATSHGPIAMFSAAGAPRPALAGHPGGTDAVAIDPTGAFVVSGGQDRVIRVWKVADATQLAALDGPTGDTHFVAVTPQLVVAAGNGGQVLAWPMRGGAVDAKARVVVAQHTGAVTALAVTATAIASAGRDATLARARVLGATATHAETTSIPSAATALVTADDGTLRAVTRTGAAVRWSIGAPPTVEIDHGVRTGAAVRGTPRWLLAFDDGTYVLADTRPHAFGELHAVATAATTFQLR